MLVNTEVAPCEYAEVRGTERIDALSRKYRGRDYEPARITSERVVVRIVPEVQRVP